MRITTKAHYAVTALLDLALNEGAGPISLPDVAARQGISLSYLEQLFARLKRHGLVISSRGRGGGYRLGKPPADISIAEVADVMDESIDTTRCAGRGDCQQGETCLTHHLWMDLSGHIYDFLDGISLADLIDRKDLILARSPQAVEQESEEQNEYAGTGVGVALGSVAKG
ncbi:MAG: Rrf2 family transcriptional regulator [Pseudomonadales bacterium]|nr:Rrf2 family transcriptional regulator [Pseudomonadales bacterium]